METEGARREIMTEPPWLLISHGEENEKHSFYNVANKRYHTKTIPELRDKHIFASAYGWLVLVECGEDDYEAECCLWNPVSMDKIELPDLRCPLEYTKCVLSKPPLEDDDCYILFTSACSYYQAFCQIGDDEFQRIITDKGWGNLLAITTFKGKIYGLTSPGYQVVIVNFVDGDLELINVMTIEDGEQQPWHIPYSSPSHIKIFDNYLIQSPCSTDQLLFVHKMYSPSFLEDGFDFKIFSLDIRTMECKELESIGDSTIFLSRWGCGRGVCCSSSTPGIQTNCIYYTDPYGRNLYIYDLDDRGKTLLLPCPAAKRSESVNYWIDHRFSQIFIN